MRSDDGNPFAVILSICLVGVFIVAGGLWGCPRYNVYVQELDGQATLAKAESTRRTKVLEAQAYLDSAKLKAQAEVTLAEGTAKANEILANKLGGPENYLRYLYIRMLDDKEHGTQREIIYVPTETGIPIMESGRAALNPKPVPKQ